MFPIKYVYLVLRDSNSLLLQCSSQNLLSDGMCVLLFCVLETLTFLFNSCVLQASKLWSVGNASSFCIQGNIQSLTAADLDKYQAHAWLLSPPCQPYTRQGRGCNVWIVSFCA